MLTNRNPQHLYLPVPQPETPQPPFNPPTHHPHTHPTTPESHPMTDQPTRNIPRNIPRNRCRDAADTYAAETERRLAATNDSRSNADRNTNINAATSLATLALAFATMASDPDRPNPTDDELPVGEPGSWVNYHTDLDSALESFESQVRRDRARPFPEVRRARWEAFVGAAAKVGIRVVLEREEGFDDDETEIRLKGDTHAFSE